MLPWFPGYITFSLPMAMSSLHFRRTLLAERGEAWLSLEPPGKKREDQRHNNESDSKLYH